MDDKQIVHRTERILTCAIEACIKNGITPTTSREYRVVRRLHGFTTGFWDFKRGPDGISRYVYAIDIPLIGNRFINEDRSSEMGRKLHLPNVWFFRSLDLGFQGYSFDDCDFQLEKLSRMLYDMGKSLRKHKSILK